MPNDEPMMQLDPNGKAPILSYNVPDATSYHGSHLIELEFPETFFKPSLKKKPSAAGKIPVAGADHATIKTAVTNEMKSGFADPKLFPGARSTRSLMRFDATAGRLQSSGSTRLSERLAALDADEITARMVAGRHLALRKNMYGNLDYHFVAEPVKARPRILLVETYRLSSFPGSYGAGKVLKTLTLLPGERTKISVKTYLKTESEQKEASSILDSFSEESADDFESSVQSEQSDKTNSAENFEYKLDAEAEQSWGSGSAAVSGGVKGGTNSAREEFAKNVTSSLNKHSMKASAKRDVQINTSFEVKEQAGEETSIEREIANLNVSRTLNFVFRQMNQEFISILHLVDVRVAFFNGFDESKREVALPQLDALLSAVVVDTSKRQVVKAAILDQLQNVFDYQGRLHTLSETVAFADPAGVQIPGASYLRIRRDYVSQHTDPLTGVKFDVPGIIMAAEKNVLRTDGVVVEALLGQGEGLDGYSRGLQEQTIRAKVLENDLTAAKLKIEEQVAQILERGDEAAAKVFAILHPPVPISSDKA